MSKKPQTGQKGRVSDLTTFGDPRTVLPPSPEHAQAFNEENLYQAQELIYDAWDARDGRSRLSLARKALKSSIFCADAWLLLSERPRLTEQERREFLERAVAVGEQALGEDEFKESEGLFWGILETRPYMRARHALAENLWKDGQRQEAIGHLQDMLRLNPGDNQGLRYLLLEWLLRTNNANDVDVLMKEYGDEYNAFIVYTAALLEFRKSGDSEEARKCAYNAFETNAYVPLFLFSPKAVPKERYGFYSPGQDSEAALYIDQYGFAWRETSKAIDWLVDLQPTDQLPGAARQ